MINAFLRLHELPPQIQDIVAWGDSKTTTGTISFSVAHHLTRLREKQDILKLAGVILQDSKPITKEELKAIISMKRRNPGKSINDCIKQVHSVTRPMLIEHFLFISGINPEIVKKLRDNLTRSGHDVDDLALDELSKKFPPSSIKKIKIHDDYMQLAMTKEGWDYVKRYSESNNLLRKDVMNHMFSSGDL